MFSGHYILILVLIIISAAALKFQGKRQLLFPAACFIIAVFFTYASIQFYNDVFFPDPGADGVRVTWSMLLLTQNDNMNRRGPYFGLKWGIGLASVFFILTIISLIVRFFVRKKINRNYSENIKKAVSFFFNS